MFLWIRVVDTPGMTLPFAGLFLRREVTMRYILVLLAAALLTFASCGGGHVIVNDPDVVSVGPLGLSESRILAEYSDGGLRISFPFINAGDASATVVTTVTVRGLAGDFSTVGTASTRIPADGGTVQVDVEAPEGIFEPSARALFVIEYRFDTSFGRLNGARSLFDAFGVPELVVLAPEEVEVGTETVVKAFLRNSVSGSPLPGRTVQVSLTGQGEPQVFSGLTDDVGTASIRVRADEPGDLTLAASVEAASGDNGASLQRSMKCVRTMKILVTTDKPMYQPGQKMLVRALALTRPRLIPASGEQVAIEIFDGKGNKVFRSVRESGEFVVVDAEFQLATQINMGTYLIKVTIGDTVSEKAVTVGRYNLPKFRVTGDFDRDWYLVGQTIRGTVDADYFFGKPVAGGTVAVAGSAWDVEFSTFASANGVTSAEGIFPFELKLPDYLVGQDLEQGKAVVRITVIVTDTAGQQVQKEFGLTVAGAPLLVSVIPESGTPVAGVENRFHVFTESPDGTPVQADVTVTISDSDGGARDIELETDKSGMGHFQFAVPGNGLSVNVVATLGNGGKGYNEYVFKPGQSAGSLLVRTDRAIYRVGDTAVVTMISADRMDRVYLDVLRSGQIIYESALDLLDSTATAEIDLDQEMSGDVVFSAYYMGTDGTIVRDEKTVFVEKADSLNVQVTPDRETYGPGDDASVTLKVTDRHGDGVRSALGIQVVDEAVYALTEMKPGLLETYFDLEKAITEPRFEVHGVSFDVAGIVCDKPAEGDTEATERREQKATAAFAAMGDSGTTTTDSSTAAMATTARNAIAPYYRQAVDELLEALRIQFESSDADEAEITAYVTGELVYTDFFGNPWTFEAVDSYQIKATTMGTDEKAGTPDDWFTTFYTYEIAWGRYEWDNGVGGWADTATAADSGVPTEEGGQGGDEPRLRSYFPETLVWNPLVVTDAQGVATIDFTMADSITQWRMTSLAHSMGGLLGSSTDGLVVFKDFFVDLDLPVTLTRGDTVEFPIAVYNYLQTPQTVSLSVETGDWAELGSGATISVDLGPNEVKGVGVVLTARKVGWHPVTVTALSSGSDDAVRRLVQVVPDGTEVRESISGRLEGPVTKSFEFPETAIEGTPSILVKVYPGVMSQVVEGLDAILQMPSGCFEQTTATLWPDALVLKYVQESGSITPEIELKAREYVNLGYQRLLTYECTGGGFTWFGDPNPANVILTALGVLEFADIAAVHEIDQTLIPRTVAWLKARQAGDGSWHETQGSEFATVQYDDLMTTCLVTWALGQTGTAPSNAISYIASNVNGDTSTYALSLCAAAMTVAAPANPATSAMLDDLLARVEDDGKLAWWSSGADSSEYYYGQEEPGTGNIEVTAMAVLALMKASRDPVVAAMAIDWMASKKDSFGNWGTTHATIQALRAFVASLSAAGSDAVGTILVSLNGVDADPVAVTAENNDVFFQFELEGVNPAAPNEVSVGFAGEGTLMYSIVQSWWMPGGFVVDPGVEGPLTIDVAYEKSNLQVDGVVGATATVKNVSTARLSMVMIDLGLPPGFDFMPDGTGNEAEGVKTLVDAISDGLVSRYETTARQILVYVPEMAPGQTLEFGWGLKARYPLTVACPKSGAYLYYDEAGSLITSPCEDFVVTE